MSDAGSIEDTVSVACSTLYPHPTDPAFNHPIHFVRARPSQVEPRMLSTNMFFPFVLSRPSFPTVVSALKMTVPAQALMNLVKMTVEVANSSEAFVAT
jgi:hypothetical protein